MKPLALTGRILFSLIFIFSGITHLGAETIAYAAAQGVPLAKLAVPASGILAMLGGLSIAFGYHARWGAAAIIVFLVPITVTMHNFWAVSDPMMAKLHLAMFMKNVAMLGGALFIAYMGAGPLSLDARAEKRRAPAVRAVPVTA
jgi:putative oxidoreductase